jgi:hypothetical protein
MEEFLRGLEGGSHTAVEAPRSWHWLVDLAEACGDHVVLLHANDEGDYLELRKPFATPASRRAHFTLKI